MTHATHAVYAGVFDPLTRGHWSVIEQGAYLFNKLTIGIGTNPSKNPMFSVQERKEIIQETICDKMRQVMLVLSDVERFGNIQVVPFEDEFLVKFAERIGAGYILRGLRDSEDFRQEQGYHFFNQDFAPNIKTVYVMPDIKYSAVSSSGIKGMVGPNGWEEFVEPYLTPPAFARVIKKHGKTAAQRPGPVG